MNNPAALDRQPIHVNDREQLIYLLAEAAEIEHGLMCCYLYAAWSLKQNEAEGLTPAQATELRRWREAIHGVAMEEMVHLALVSNLLMSVGAPPHFARPNFPVGAGYYPSSVVMRLTPFTRATADHFVYLERPEGSELEPASGFEAPVAYRRHQRQARLTPTAEDYGTVSHLYRGIGDGLRRLAARLGEEALFCGVPHAQVAAPILSLPGLRKVTGLDDALAAIDTIVEQGEGAPDGADDSHYLRFVGIREAYDAFLAQDPGFVPHRPVVAVPVMFAPLSGEARSHVAAPEAAAVLDLANASYGLMLRLLASGFGQADAGKDARRVELDGAITVMGVVRSLSVLLTTLPCGMAGATAGMNFHLPRATLALPQRDTARAVLAERALELAAALDGLALAVPGADNALAARMRAVAAGLAPA